jgi:hypothetical protein
MRPNISEFSYGYALTEELATAHRSVLTAAPVLPSLTQEGKQGVGWDMRLETLGIPAFLQFKLGHPVFRRNAREYQSGKFSAPAQVKGVGTPLLYRMHLRPPRHSNQHESLVTLEANGHLVYYVAPAFYQPADLNDAYLDRNVASRSFWLRPGAVTIPDDSEHHVSYVSPHGPYCICSATPQSLETDGTFEAFVRTVHDRLTDRPPVALSELLAHLSADLTESVLTRVLRAKRGDRRPTSQVELEVRTVLERPEESLIERTRATLQRAQAELEPRALAAYLARMFFDAELMIVGPPLTG